MKAGGQTRRDLIFCLQAVQMGLLEPRILVDAGLAWSRGETQGLREEVILRSGLDHDSCELIDRVVDKVLERHGGDSGRSLMAIGGRAAVLTGFGGTILTDEEGVIAPASSEELDSHPAHRVTPENPGRYTIRGEQGHGGIGRVLIAFDEHIGREIALKELLPDRANLDSPGTPMGQTAAAAARFLREARITGQLEHPSIVPVYEIGEKSDGRFYYTMKMVRGRTLERAIVEARQLEERLKLLPHFADLCNAIAYAHSRGVIHRDIKPQNVMIGQFGETVVLDWGLAKVKDRPEIEDDRFARQMAVLKEAAAGKTAAGEAIGTPCYMPPEQAWGELEKIDERSDVYSLGAVLYEILTGRPPFEGESAFEVIGKVQAYGEGGGTLPAIGKAAPQVPAELAAIAIRALDSNKEARYPTADAVAEEVEAYMAGRRVESYEYSSWELARRFLKRHRLATFVALTAVIIVSCITLLSYLKIGQQRDLAKAQRDAARRFANAMLVDINDRIKELPGTTEVRRLMLEQALKYLKENSGEVSASPEQRFDLAMAYMKVAELARDLGQTEPANDALSQADSIMSTLRTGTRTLSIQVEYQSALLQEQRGDIMRVMRKDNDAQRLYGKATALLEALVSSDPGNVRYSRSLAMSYQKLGDFYYEVIGDFPKSQAAYSKALSLQEPLLGKAGEDLEYQLELSISYVNLGELHLNLSAVEQALLYFEKALQVRQQLARTSPVNSTYQRNLAVVHERLGDLYFSLGDLEKARSYFGQDLEISKRLALLDPNDVLHQRDLAVSLVRMRDLSLAQGKLEEAMTYCLEDRSIAEALAAWDEKNERYQEDLADSLLGCAGVARMQGKDSQGRELAGSSVAILRRLSAAHPTNLDLQLTLSDGYYASGEFPAQLVILKQLAAISPGNPLYSRKLVRALTLNGNHAEAMEKGDGALSLNQKDTAALLLIRLFLAISAHQQGRKEESRNHLQEASNIVPALTLSIEDDLLPAAEAFRTGGKCPWACQTLTKLNECLLRRSFECLRRALKSSEQGVN